MGNIECKVYRWDQKFLKSNSNFEIGHHERLLRTSSDQSKVLIEGFNTIQKGFEDVAID